MMKLKIEVFLVSFKLYYGSYLGKDFERAQYELVSFWLIQLVNIFYV